MSKGEGTTYHRTLEKKQAEKRHWPDVLQKKCYRKTFKCAESLLENQ